MPIADAQARGILADCFEESAKQLRDESNPVPFEWFHNAACVTVQIEVEEPDEEHPLRIVIFGLAPQMRSLRLRRR